MGGDICRGDRAPLRYALGEAPSPSNTSRDEPLSRVPPRNGTAEVLWRHPQGAYFGGALRWARLQDLSLIHI